MSNSLPEGVVRIHLDTERRFSARIAAQIIDAMAASIEANTEVGVDIETALIASGEGTWWAHLLVIGGSLGAGVLAVQGLATEIREGRTPFTRGVSAALDEGDGRAVTLCADDVEIRIGIAEIIAYPPPVGEDRADWVTSSDPPFRDWAGDPSAVRMTEDGGARITEEGKPRALEDSARAISAKETHRRGSPTRSDKLNGVRFVDPTKARPEDDDWIMTVPTKSPDVVDYHASALYEGTFYKNSEGDFIRTVDTDGGKVFNLRGYPKDIQLPFYEGQRILVDGKPDYEGGIYPRHIILAPDVK